MDYTNLDRLYDGLSVSDIEAIFNTLEMPNKAQSGKNGLDDCMQDGLVRTSIEQEATKAVIDIKLSQDKELNKSDLQK